MTFASVYEILDPLTVIRKQKFWDWFDGSDVKAFWNKNLIGSSSIAMEDAVNDGVKLSTGATIFSFSMLDFNSINHYSHTASAWILMCRLRDAVQDRFRVGLNDFQDAASFTQGYVWDALTGTNTNHQLVAVNTTSSATDSDIAISTNIHVYSAEITSSDVKGKIDGVLKATHTTTLPTIALQPKLTCWNNTAADRALFARYYEAYNT